MINTVPIIYNGGSYGTYLEWCLTTLTSTGAICPPFTHSGSSHVFKGNQLRSFADWIEYTKSNCVKKFVRFHPKTQQNDSLTDILNQVCQSVNFAIYLYPDPDSVLLCLNNCYSKIWKDWWAAQFSSQVSLSIDPNKIYENWPVSRDTDINNVPVWIRREFLSYYLMPSWLDQVEWHHPSTWSNSKCCTVFISNLLYDFKHTLQTIGNHCNLHYSRSIDELLEYHSTNLSLQKNLTQDQLCKTIITAVTEGQDYNWNTLPFVSEVWIQWQLRNLGFEIQCDGLDNLPTNSLQLRELLYPV
jgi:hypothetical protein